jgi:hypothetical protein
MNVLIVQCPIRQDLLAENRAFPECDCKEEKKRCFLGFFEKNGFLSHLCQHSFLGTGASFLGTKFHSF